MKNQNDLIISIVAAVLGIGFSIAFFFMKRVPVTPTPPQQVVTTKLALPAADPVMANGLSGGGNAAGGMGGPGGMPGGIPGMGPMGRPGGMGGPGMGPMGRPGGMGGPGMPGPGPGPAGL